ncbi:hypothetical protein CC86DRAFT_103096 [Ophiobolus disseminans]|uniref:Uncharacterized protein n=1 Tax=Ophiobolus disseminans TaxID=1469910 RepID=A0A6A6ZJT9_9PLEO|nr:hypothetical protein CC86DRAFT_103096 [Ophiobolus disseminans]
MLDDHPSDPKQASLEQILELIKQWIKAHPYQSIFHIVNGAIILSPAIATVPALAGLGLGAGGPIPAFAAPAIQSWLGTVEAGSWFAIGQSAGMGGYGAGIVAGAAQMGAAASSATLAYLMRKRRNGPKL